MPMQNQTGPKATHQELQSSKEEHIVQVVDRLVQNRFKELERQIAMLEAALRRRGDWRYLSVNEVGKRFRLNHRTVMESIRSGEVSATRRERGRGGKACYLIREDEAERFWGSGLPV